MTHQPRTLQDFIAFRYMMTPAFIQIIWIIGSVIIVIGGLGGAIAGGSFLAFLGGVIGMLVGVVIWRVYCELLILLFRIHDAIVESKDAGQAPHAPPDEAS